MVISIYDRFNDKQNRISNMLYGSYLELALVITQLIFRSEKLKDMLHRIAIFQTSENENEFSPEVHITFILIPNSSVQSTIILSHIPTTQTSTMGIVRRYTVSIFDRIASEPITLFGQKSLEHAVSEALELLLHINSLA